MDDFQYKYLTSMESQLIILAALFIREMSVDELCNIIMYADKAKKLLLEKKDSDLLKSVLAQHRDVDASSGGILGDRRSRGNGGR